MKEGALHAQTEETYGVGWGVDIVFSFQIGFINIKFSQPEWTCQNKEVDLY